MLVAPDLDGFDYWEVHPARGAISRVHVEWRLSPYNPANLPEGVDVARLQKTRVTQKEFADGTADVEEDEWGGTPRVSNTGVHRKTKGALAGLHVVLPQGGETRGGTCEAADCR